MSHPRGMAPSFHVAGDHEESPLVPSEISRPPSYGAPSTGPPTAFATESSELASGRGSKPPPRTIIKCSTLACLLLQHISSSLANAIYHFAMFIIMVDVFEDTLAPSSFIGLITMSSAIIFAGKVGGIVDNTTRLSFVQYAVGLQKCVIIFSFIGFLLLFGPLNGLSAKVFHADSSTVEKVEVYGILLFTALCASVIWLTNVGINVAVEKEWVTTIAQGDSSCLTKLNAYMTSIDLLAPIAGPMVVSAFTSCMSYAAALKCLTLLVAACGTLELFWIQVVYDRFPVLRRDELERGRGKIRLDTTLEERGVASRSRCKSQEGRVAEGSWRDEVVVWSDFIKMPLFFGSLAQSMTWLTVLHFDATGVAHFKMSAGDSDISLACARSLCMLSCLIGTCLMPRIERRFGLARTGFLGLSFGIICFIACTTAFFLEPHFGQYGPSTAGTVNTAVMFAGIILARMGHVNFDLAQVKTLQQDLVAHPRRNRMTALQTSLQASFNLCKHFSTIVFATQATFKWAVLITLLANLGAMASYLNFPRLKRKKRI